MLTLEKPIAVETIVAGKLRRYHTLSFLRQAVQFRTIVLPNIVDGFKLIVGFGQSFVKLLIWRPDVIFAKGGFVCLPVGLSAHILRIPLVIHDSDAHPGLTSRVLSQWASAIATGAPLKYYPYPKKKSHYIGIPINSQAKPKTRQEADEYKKAAGFDPHMPLVVVIGGGLGAQALNDAVVRSLEDLTAFTSVAVVAGNANVEMVKRAASVKDKSKFQAYGHIAITDLLQMYASADIVVTRAGATTLLELATLGKPTIIVPNEILTGGHQVKNAEVYKKAKAAMIVSERELDASPLVLVDAINAILLNKALQKQLSANIKAFAKPKAATEMAALILAAIRRPK